MSLGVSFRVFSHFSILKCEKTRIDTKRHQRYIRSQLIRFYSHCIMSLGVSFCVFSYLFASFRVSFRVFSHFSILKMRKDTKRQKQYIRSRLILVYSHCIMSLGVSFRVFSRLFASFRVSFRVFSPFSLTVLAKSLASTRQPDK